MRLKILFLNLIIAASAHAQPAVHYELSFPNAAHHEAEIEAIFTGLDPRPLEIVMSRSSPGRYALHEFAKNISNFRASDVAGHPLLVEHTSPDSWLVNPSQAAVVCRYTLYGDRVDGTYAAIDLTHAHLNLPATLVWAKGLENAPVTLRFNVPEGLAWKPYTQLVPNSDGSFSAPNLASSNLEWLMDSSVELSSATLREWSLHGARFRLALHHEGTDAEASNFAEMCKNVVAEERAVFGEFPHFDNGTYTFLVDLLPHANGDGMEHRDSTVISAPLDLRTSAHNAIGTVSHEFFHAWNVKRIRPISLEPFDFERANMSGELWFAEGFTNYYGTLLLRRANLRSFDEFLTAMGRAINDVLNDPGRDVFSAVGMSEQAPFVDAATSIDPTDTANNFISYYTYGQALAFGIDLAIRNRFPGKSLDDWMRTTWHRHPDAKQPYTLRDLEASLAEITNDRQFAHSMFEESIQGKKPLDYQQLIAPAGLSLTLKNQGQVWLGATNTISSDAGVYLKGPTLRGSPLYKAGIDSGDQIQQCGSVALKAEAKLDSCLASHRVGDIISLRVKGRTGIRSVGVTLAQDPTLQLVSFEQQGKPVSRQISEYRVQWLSSKLGLSNP